MAPSLGSLAWTRLEARRRGEATIVVELTPGGTCNIVDQPGAFIFDNGAIFTHSHHEDCVVKGLRIDTTFQVTGGVRAIAGASGSGQEFGAMSMSAASTSFSTGQSPKNGPPARGAHGVRAGRISQRPSCHSTVREASAADAAVCPMCAPAAS